MKRPDRTRDNLPRWLVRFRKTKGDPVLFLSFFPLLRSEFAFFGWRGALIMRIPVETDRAYSPCRAGGANAQRRGGHGVGKHGA